MGTRDNLKAKSNERREVQVSRIPEDLPYLLYRAISELGWSTDHNSLADSVRRLDIGLPAEDEFSVICSWLGKCKIIHKLDQNQIPADSRKNYRVPDLLAHFSTQKENKPILIEVKSKIRNKLSFRPDYLQGLKNYADMVGADLLIAWKRHSLWTLFSYQHMKIADVNYNINHETAMKENLLGVLVGDMSYKIGLKSGFHLRLEKEELISAEKQADGNEEKWRMRISDAYFTNKNGDTVQNLSNDVKSLLMASAMYSEDVSDNNDHIIVSCTVKENSFQFAHRALVDLLAPFGSSTEPISWRREAQKDKLNTIDDIGRAIRKAYDEKIITHVFHQQPNSMPDFLSG